MPLGDAKEMTMTFVANITDDDIRDITGATVTSERERILREAKDNICGQREQDYGSPENNFQLIADLWSAYTGYEFNSLDVAMMMCLLKMARIKNGGGTGDSFVDLAGYAACGGEIWHGMSV